MAESEAHATQQARSEVFNLRELEECGQEHCHPIVEPGSFLRKESMRTQQAAGRLGVLDWMVLGAGVIWADRTVGQLCGVECGRECRASVLSFPSLFFPVLVQALPCACITGMHTLGSDNSLLIWGPSASGIVFPMCPCL